MILDVKIDFWVYSLICKELVEDWGDLENPGTLKEIPVVKTTVVVNDPADRLFIGAYGKDGKFYQFDSYEAYYAHSFFAEDFDKHGLAIESKHFEVDTKHLKEIS